MKHVKTLNADTLKKSMAKGGVENAKHLVNLLVKHHVQWQINLVKIINFWQWHYATAFSMK